MDRRKGSRWIEKESVESKHPEVGTEFEQTECRVLIFADTRQINKKKAL
jgi:hypothetical protein